MFISLKPFVNLASKSAVDNITHYSMVLASTLYLVAQQVVVFKRIPLDVIISIPFLV